MTKFPCSLSLPLTDDGGAISQNLQNQVRLMSPAKLDVHEEGVSWSRRDVRAVVACALTEAHNLLERGVVQQQQLCGAAGACRLCSLPQRSHSRRGRSVRRWNRDMKVLYYWLTPRSGLDGYWRGVRPRGECSLGSRLKTKQTETIHRSEGPRRQSRTDISGSPEPALNLVLPSRQSRLRNYKLGAVSRLLLYTDTTHLSL